MKRAAMGSWLAPGGVFLAWRQLRHQGRRLLAAVCGIIFVVMSTLFQMGVYSALFKSVAGLFTHVRADLVMVSPDYRSVTQNQPFPEERLFQAAGQPGVASVARLVLADGFWRNPKTREIAQGMIIAVEPSENALDFPELAAGGGVLKRGGAMLVDRNSAAEFGPIAPMLAAQGPFYAEINQRRVLVGGTFALGTSFAYNGHFLMGLDTYAQLAPERRGQITLGLLRLQPGADAGQVAAALRARLPADVRVMTLAEFTAKEKQFWFDFTPVGYVIPMSLLVALIVGGVVIYQILYTCVNDHLREYATLKAMGYGDRILSRFVLQQALLLSLLGFPPGLALSAALFWLSRAATGLPFAITLGEVSLAFVLTVAMCFIAGMGAMRKLRQADPAEVFA